MTGLVAIALLLELGATAVSFWCWQRRTALPAETAQNPVGYQISSRLLQIEQVLPPEPLAVGEVGVAKITVTNHLPLVLENIQLRLPQPAGFEVELDRIEVAGHHVVRASVDHGTVVVPLGLLQAKRRRTLHIPLRLVYTRPHAD